MQKYGQFLDYDKIFVLFEASLKGIEAFVRLAASQNKDLVFIRTKCDRFDDKQFKTLEQEMESDRTLLQSWGIRNIKLFSATANKKFSKEFDKFAIK